MLLTAWRTIKGLRSGYRLSFARARRRGVATYATTIGKRRNDPGGTIVLTDDDKMFNRTTSPEFFWHNSTWRSPLAGALSLPTDFG
jgi:hypothetical protein